MENLEKTQKYRNIIKQILNQYASYLSTGQKLYGAKIGLKQR